MQPSVLNSEHSGACDVSQSSRNKTCPSCVQYSNNNTIQCSPLFSGRYAQSELRNRLAVVLRIRPLLLQDLKVVVLPESPLPRVAFVTDEDALALFLQQLQHPLCEDHGQPFLARDIESARAWHCIVTSTAAAGNIVRVVLARIEKLLHASGKRMLAEVGQV